MQNFSQNNEQQFILEYFGNKVGTLLDIGANDGQTLSNSRALILKGWKADLVEPAPKPFEQLKELYKDNHDVNLIDAGICDYTGLMSFHVSGEHLGKGDSGLLSTLSLVDKQKWEHTTEYNSVTIQTYSWEDFWKHRGYPKYDFISIDAEGYDEIILKQMDLIELGCSCICVEHNGTAFNEITTYLHKFNMKALLVNSENVIFAV